MKILFIGEFSKIATGYGKITSELINRFYSEGHEVAELATFCAPDNPKIQECPWKVYPNLPANDKEAEEYHKNPQNANGKWKLEQVLLDFMPTHVFGNGDPFFYEYQMHSPFRDYFNWIITAPVDGVPQHNQWIQIFNNADGLTTYTEWGKNILESYDLKVNGVTPPVASDDFFPIPQDRIEKFKKSIGLDNKKIIGTVMRNQPRKLFNHIFEIFKEFVKTHPNTLLYCHTTYPDAGWDFSELLIRHNIIDKVLFTYKCKTCNQAYSSYFQDLKTVCPFCKNLTAKMPDGHDNVDNETLNKIINMFDVYLQLASREGFGIPQIEAAACDIPIVTMNCAGMKDILQNLIAFPIDVEDTYLSYPMNMIESLPKRHDVEHYLAKALTVKKAGLCRKKYEESYQSWDKTYNTFHEIFSKLDTKEWQRKPIKPIPEFNELEHVSNEGYSIFLIQEVLNKPELLGSYLQTRLIKELNSGITFGGHCGNYFTEPTEMRNYQPFDRRKAYDICFGYRKYSDYWQAQLNAKLGN